jgi:DNA-binding transcriptional ArsR family regulator
VVTGVNEVGAHARSIRARWASMAGCNGSVGPGRMDHGRGTTGAWGLTSWALSGRLRFVNAYRDPTDPFEALGDATRRAIVEGLRDGERTVGDLAADLPVSRPAVSQHLGVLKAAGLVQERPQGTRRYYRLDPIGLVRLQGRLDTMWGLDEMGPAVAAPRVGAPAPAPVQAPTPTADAAPAAGRRDDEKGGKGAGKKHKKKHGRK